MILRALFSRRLLLSASCAAALLLAGCSGGGGGSGSSFVIRTTDHAVNGVTPILVQGFWMVYFANEAFTGPTGTDLNGDMDTTDNVAVVTRVNSNTSTVIGVAAIAAAIVGDEIYLVVDEAEDGVDWDGMNGIGDLVLLHYSDAAGLPATFVDTLDADSGATAVQVAGTRAYYAAENATPMGDETSLRFVESSDPTTPVTVMNAMGGGVLEPVILGEDDGLLFLLLDETETTVDYNGDADMTDEHVLALLDGLDPMATITNVGLALEDEDAPVAALPVGADDWLVAFLVNEADQGATNLNDQALFVNQLLPDSCAGTPDADTMDDVLHYLEYLDFMSGMSTAVNTGLAGEDRVVAVSGYVATLSDEGDANCDLNEDGDSSDTMARWVEAVTPIAPPRDPSQLHAVMTGILGGSMGLATLGDRFVIVVDEAQDSDDIDGKPDDHNLVAWLDPAAGFAATWTFSHQSGNPSHGTGLPGEPFAGASWLAGEAVNGRLGLAFQEEVPDLSLNNFTLNCTTDMRDGDTLDSLPIFADFEAGPTLDFDGLGFAVVTENPGIVFARGFAFFRVDEMRDSRDYNGDGAANDVVLMRNPTTTCAPVVLATSSTTNGPVLVTDGDRGAAFLTSEFQDGTDLNGDGDINDLVVQYFNY